MIGNKSNQICCNITIFLILLVFCFILPFNAIGQQAKPNAIINIETNKKPLKEIVQLISDQINTKIKIDSEWLDLPVSGKFQKVEVGSFFRRVLKGQNITVLYDESNNQIIIRSFSSSAFKTYNSLSDERNDGVDQISGVKLSDIKELRKKEAIDKQEYFSNPESIDQMSGMTLGEIASLREQEKEAKEIALNSPDSVDQMTGLLIAEINKLHEREKKEIEEYFTNPKSVDQISGLKVTEINNIRAIEAQKIEEYYSNPSSIDQMSGLTLDEIAKIREREKYLQNSN